jgi:hypothetical protein
MVGQTILHYRIVENLGRGGMGVVQIAEYAKRQSPALKRFLFLPIIAFAHVEKHN